jgi:chemotaxis protein histidine kinase CheA
MAGRILAFYSVFYVYLAPPAKTGHMEYGKIIAVTGLPGLYEMVSSKTDGAIVRSLDDKTTRFVATRVHNFSHLESIEVYTTRENVNLVDVLKAMQASSEPLPSEKDGDAIKSYFQKVYPELDFDRVYVSDMKKMVKWFSVLTNNNIELKVREASEEAEPAEAAVEESVEAPEAVKPPAKKAAKPKAPKAEAATEEPAEKPAKKAAKKKKED